MKSTHISEDPAQNGVQHLLRPRPYPDVVSVVVPVFNEEAGLEYLCTQLEEFGRALLCPLEIVLVNDGSTDRTAYEVAEIAERDHRVKVLHLSRNFGHQVAATAGLDYATGDATVLIDADLQDPLPVVHEMIARYCQGYDVVYGQRANRAGESRFKLVTAWLFYRSMKYLVYHDLPVDTGDFRLLSRPCLDALKTMRETHRFLRGMVAWVGFPQIAIKYERAPRLHGITKYPLRKMLSFAWTAATSFSTLPLRVSLYLGTIVGLFAIEEAVRALVVSETGKVVPGWTSLMIVTSVIGSALLFSIGVVGQYVGRLYEQAKDRPLYFVARTCNVMGTAGVDAAHEHSSSTRTGHKEAPVG